MENWFDVRGRWPPRDEGTDAVARRLADTFGAFSAIDPLFRSWRRHGFRHRSIVPREVTMPPSLSELRDWVDENPTFEARGGRKTCVGHAIFARAVTDGEPGAVLSLFLDLSGRQTFFHSSITLGVLTPKDDPLSLRRGAKAMVLALARAWDVTWAGVTTGNFSKEGHQPQKTIPIFESGWMVYVDRDHASRIAEPEDIRVEAQSDGGVLLIATKEPFSRRNEIHRAAARRIQTALEPLNVDDAT